MSIHGIPRPKTYIPYKAASVADPDNFSADPYAAPTSE
jgi:hypothetical protein